MTSVSAHFVIFSSPGTFFAEQSSRPIEAWDVAQAQAMAADIKERHGSRPYGFQFITKGRGDFDLDSKEIARSPFYYLGGTVRTLAQVENENRKDEDILRSNMRINQWDRVITSNSPWRWTQPLRDGDVVLASSNSSEGSSR